MATELGGLALVDGLLRGVRHGFWCFKGEELLVNDIGIAWCEHMRPRKLTRLSLGNFPCERDTASGR